LSGGIVIVCVANVVVVAVVSRGSGGRFIGVSSIGSIRSQFHGIGVRPRSVNSRGPRRRLGTPSIDSSRVYPAGTPAAAAVTTTVRITLARAGLHRAAAVAKEERHFFAE
jgi:hypothetical protein